jgi:hypothetical protein
VFVQDHSFGDVGNPLSTLTSSLMSVGPTSVTAYLPGYTGQPLSASKPATATSDSGSPPPWLLLAGAVILAVVLLRK